jgi:hypothetical protein
MSFYKGEQNADPTEQVLPGVFVTKASRKPCPVCGHPTGDCTGKVEESHILLADEAPPEKNLVKVKERITKEVWVTPLTKARVVVADAGAYVTVEKAKELGII